MRGAEDSYTRAGLEGSFEAAGGAQQSFADVFAEEIALVDVEGRQIEFELRSEQPPLTGFHTVDLLRLENGLALKLAKKGAPTSSGWAKVLSANWFVNVFASQAQRSKR